MSEQKLRRYTNGDSQVAYKLYTSDIQEVEGKLLTIIDAVIQDPQQRKAVKDIVRGEWWNYMLSHVDNEATKILQTAFKPE